MSESMRHEVVLSARQVKHRVRALAMELDRAYADAHDLVLVGVLRGAVYLLADLSRALHIPHRLDFVEYKSYAGTERGPLVLLKPWGDSFVDADVVIVDEIWDSGETLLHLRTQIEAENPRSVTCCVLLAKRGVSPHPPPEFVGAWVGADFLVGYGLDYDQQLRHLPHVARLRPS